MFVSYAKSWFPNWVRKRRNGRDPYPIELKVLGVLRVLAKGSTFDQIYELNNISAETNRIFFHSFCAKAVEVLGPTWISIPRTDDELSPILTMYAKNGFPGCVGSIDCVHIRWDNCPAKWRNMYRGKGAHPTISYEVTVSHDKTILFATIGHYGTRNDKTIVRFDGFVSAIHECGLYAEKTFNLYQCDGVEKEYKGYYLMCDGGYHRWRCLQCGYSQPLGESDSNYTSHIGSVRKDVECTFGILKIRFRILRSPIIYKKKVQIDNVFKFCCILHNILKANDTTEGNVEDYGYDSEPEQLERTVGNRRTAEDVTAVDHSYMQKDLSNGTAVFGTVENVSTEKGAGFDKLRKALKEHVNYLKMTKKIVWKF